MGEIQISKFTQNKINIPHEKSVANALVIILLDVLLEYGIITGSMSADLLCVEYNTSTNN